MDYNEINLKIQIKGEVYAIPCNIAITPDKNKLVIVIKQERVGAVHELRDRIIEEGKRLE